MSARPPAPQDDGLAPEEGLSSAWDRLAPLSLGAVASSALIVMASAGLRRLLGPGRRALGWLGVAALLPLAVWVLWDDGESTETNEGSNSVSGARTERSKEPNGG